MIDKIIKKRKSPSTKKEDYIFPIHVNAALAYISEALGHSNLKTTQNYFGRFEDEGLKVFHSGLMEGLVD